MQTSQLADVDPSDREAWTAQILYRRRLHSEVRGKPLDAPDWTLDQRIVSILDAAQACENLVIVGEANADRWSGRRCREHLADTHAARTRLREVVTAHLQAAGA